MSLFPIRLRPGGTITVHVRLKLSEPRWVHRQDHLVDPLGRRTLCHDRWLLVTPPITEPEDYALARESDQIIGGAPLLMAARYLQSDTKRADYFVDMFQGLRDSVHHYYTVTLPPEAPLGRYRFDFRDDCDGVTIGSTTADTDFFLVEQLFLQGVERRGDVTVATLENPSPEPVLAQLCQGGRVELVRLAPRSVTPLELRGGSGVLVYRDGDEILPLVAPSDPLVLRDPSLRWADKPDATFVFRTNEAAPRGWELTGVAADLWRRARGDVPRSVLRQPENADEYDQLLRLGLLRELTAAQLSGDGQPARPR